MADEPTLIGLGESATVLCALPLARVFRLMTEANARHADVVELPIDWSTSDVRYARESLIGLRYVRSVRSLHPGL